MAPGTEGRAWIAWAIGAGAFIVLGVLVMFESPLPGERWSMSMVQGLRPPGIQALGESAAAIGHWSVVWVLSGLGVAWLLWRGRRAYAALAGIAPVLMIVPPAIKPLFGRPRPEPDAVITVSELAKGYSFPSGHAFHGAEIAAVVFIVTAPMPPGRVRVAVRLLACAVALVIGWQRVFVGAHWPSDVLAGFLLGTLAVGATWQAIQAAAGASNRW